MTSRRWTIADCLDTCASPVLLPFIYARPYQRLYLVLPWDHRCVCIRSNREDVWRMLSLRLVSQRLVTFVYDVHFQ